jgi:single-strand DNA-binding protein
MSDLNLHQVIGRLGRDPETKTTTGGQTVTKFSVATGRKYKDKSGEMVEQTCWHNVVTWGKLAEICGQHLAKGRQVYVAGRSETRKYEDKEGVTKYATDLVANEVQFLGSKGDAPAKGDDAPFNNNYVPDAGGDDSIPF